jgi:Flp pilus assembly protein TadG
VTYDLSSKARGEGGPQPSHRDRERGAALVEFVLLIPVFIMLLLGIVSAGTVYNHKLDLVHAAREGARYGATIPKSQCTPSTKCAGKTWAELVQSVVVARSDGDVVTNQVCVSLVSGNDGTPLDATFTTKSDGTRCYDDGNDDTGFRVQVRIVRSGDALNGAFFRVPVTLASSATAKLEQ